MQGKLTLVKAQLLLHRAQLLEGLQLDQTRMCGKQVKRPECWAHQALQQLWVAAQPLPQRVRLLKSLRATEGLCVEGRTAKETGKNISSITPVGSTAPAVLAPADQGPQLNQQSLCGKATADV